LRRDALTGAAEMILAIERCAQAVPDLVATVGRIEAKPGAVNVIPGSVTFSLDVRAPTDPMRADAVAAITAELSRIAERRELSVNLEKTHDAPATICDAALIGQLASSVQRAGIPPRRLPSGAGHDAMAVAELCPVAMLFVRCAGGISHNPAESITTEDADLAVRVLLDFIRHFEKTEA
jgi:allantoate deiminase